MAKANALYTYVCHMRNSSNNCAQEFLNYVLDNRLRKTETM